MLGRSDIEAFLRRLAFLAAEGRVSVDARTRICREVRHLLGRFRALGLTRPGGPAAGLGDDFALAAGDVPIKPEDPEPNRDLPAEILRQLCEHLPALEHAISCREVRVAVELIIDTGRRPDEICALRWDCLEYDEDRSPVLVYDNHKNARLGRRLPIAHDTADADHRPEGSGPSTVPRHPADAAEAAARRPRQPARATRHHRGAIWVPATAPGSITCRR